ncbi:putative bifunctional diguanylate cyclase/phosphodiesterase [Limnobacter sp.]|uniref:putative bifunctional diguanylate cyclase/phosphodiesterase n=1 Tax=Limnobacter sp. TaxID=2003368 RepID=UPI003514032A
MPYIPNLSALSAVEHGLWLSAVALAFAWWLLRKVRAWVLKPLYDLTTCAQQLSQGNFDVRLQFGKLSAVNALVHAINQTAQHLQEREQQARRTAYQDQLTHLFNRAYLQLALSDRTHRAREPLSVLTWSVDNMDAIQEVLGHEVADQILIRVATKARRVCRDNVVLARVEGSVFCVVIPRRLLAIKLARFPMLRLLQGELRLRHHKLDLQGHAGIAHYPEHGQCAEALLRRAEIARQLAKKTRQTWLEFEPRFEQRAADRLQLIAQLRDAIAHEQFCFYVQPKLNLRNNSINQAELLLRWNHPNKGLIAPGGFIELAEQTGLIKEITRLVLRKAYDIAALCVHQNLRLSLNLSALDVEDLSLVQYVARLHRLQPEASRHLMLEITESAAMRDPEQALDVLGRFSDMGFQIAIDDFGTGYSSLAYLKRFPVTELKIDRSLVQGADRDTDGQIILESTIEMGHIMGLVVTTEGVETQAEYELVRQLGADYLQGYWLSRPMPFDEFRIKHLVGNHTALLQPASNKVPIDQNVV